MANDKSFIQNFKNQMGEVKKYDEQSQKGETIVKEEDLQAELEQKFQKLFGDINNEITNSLEAISEEFEINTEDFNEEEIDNIVTLIDENGKEIEYEFLDFIEYEGEEYIILLPSGEVACMEVLILRVEGADTDDESYVSVDSMETLNAVFKIFKNKIKNEIDCY